MFIRAGVHAKHRRAQGEAGEAQYTTAHGRIRSGLRQDSLRRASVGIRRHPIPSTPLQSTRHLPWGGLRHHQKKPKSRFSRTNPARSTSSRILANLAIGIAEMAFRKEEPAGRNRREATRRVIGSQMPKLDARRLAVYVCWLRGGAPWGILWRNLQRVNNALGRSRSPLFLVLRQARRG